MRCSSRCASHSDRPALMSGAWSSRLGPERVGVQPTNPWLDRHFSQEELLRSSSESDCSKRLRPIGERPLPGPPVWRMRNPFLEFPLLAKLITRCEDPSPDGKMAVRLSPSRSRDHTAVPPLFFCPELQRRRNCSSAPGDQSRALLRPQVSRH